MTSPAPPPVTWGFTVYSPTGAAKGSVSQDESYVRQSGLRMQVTPEGDCLEATFEAKGQGLGIGPLDCVQIVCNGAALFYGEVRVGGNRSDIHGHQYTLRSLALRLKEVTIPPDWTAPQQAAELTVRSLLDAVSPQLGGTIAGIRVDPLGFDCRAIKNAHQQNPYALLEQIASDGAGMNVKVRFGVSPERILFATTADTGSVSLELEQCTSATRWTAPVAETPCTAVLWYVAKKPDGSWLTHTSEAPEAAVYGRRVRPVSLTSSEGVWQVVPGTWYEMTKEKDKPWTYTEVPDNLKAYLTNRDLMFGGVGPTAAGLVGMLFAPSSPVQRYAIRSVVTQGSTELRSLEGTPSELAATDEVGQRGSEVSEYVYSPKGPNFALICPTEIQGPNGLLENSLTVFEFRGEILDTALLDKLARYYYNIPHESPADIEVRGLLPGRAGFVALNGWQGPVAAFEYRISAERGLTTGVLAGQSDDPEKLAAAALIRARDAQAVITAITSGGT